MAVTVIGAGKIYNGKIHKWKDKDGNERLMFRGRINYRNKATGEYEFIDAVCWRDAGNNHGLVGFLAEYFCEKSDNAPTDKGGQPIEFMAQLSPVANKMTVPITIKKLGKTFNVEVDAPTFELILDSAEFPPSTEKRNGKSRNNTVLEDDEFDEFDDIDEDDIVVGGGDADDEDDFEEEEIEVVEKPARTSGRGRTTSNSRSTTGNGRSRNIRTAANNTGKKKTGKNRAADSDDEFFE